jgi:hypothetical protein
MVASAVGLIIIAAALAAFDLQSQFARNTERLLSAQSAAGLGLTMMQRDLENAGLRFRGGVQNAGGPNFAAVVRPYDNLGGNIASLRNDLAGTTLVATAGNAAGFVPGTDAFEVYQGATVASQQRLGAQVAQVVALTPTQVRVRISPSPFTPGELAAAGSSAPLLMFWTDDIHCMGRMTAVVSVVGTVVTILVDTVDADLASPGPAWAVGCPGALNNVEILQQRRRYLVYQTAGAAGRPARLGLYMQSNAPCDPLNLPGTSCSSDLQQAPSMVAEGVDDMQITWRVPDTDLVATNGWCQNKPADPTCGFDLAVWTPAISRRVASIYGAQIFVASRGQEIYRRPGEAVPALLNHVPAPPIDNVVRAVMQNSVLFRNYLTP